MPTLRIENFRDGQWQLRGEGEVPADTSIDAIKDSADLNALNHPTRAFLDGRPVYETKKITGKRAKALFGL